MSKKQLTQEALDTWVDGLIGRGRVVGVKAKGERYAFGDLAQASDLRLDYDVTILPPKKYFLPQKEELLRFSGEGYECVTGAEPFVLLGVHPYDMVAISQMDKVFSVDNKDEHYFARRDRVTIVVCDIQSVSTNTFAASVGTATKCEGHDVRITKAGEAYVVESASEKGEALMADLGSAEEPDSATLARRDQVWECNGKMMSQHELRVDPADLPAILGASYDHPVWEERAEKCFSCGSCNLVCPTCYCFDVQDDVNWDLKSGSRCRAWDGCMLTNFATVAGDHNFRKNRADRYRHRYYRKAKYVPEKIGELSCVGCGRCITACVSKIANPVEVYNRVAEVK